MMRVRTWVLAVAILFVGLTVIKDYPTETERVVAILCLLYILVYVVAYIGVLLLFLVRRLLRWIRLQMHPITHRVRRAWSRLRPFSAAIQEGTERALREFLDNYPGHKREAEAQQVLMDITEGRHISELLNEHKLKFQAIGLNIEMLQVRLRRAVPYHLRARIPLGTYFTSAKDTVHNMVTTAESDVTLATSEWYVVDVPAACANRTRAIPGGDDTFTIQRSPHQDELARLMAMFHTENVSHATRQAAIWIVTDNASYRDLGYLVSPSPLGNIRVIRESEAARAMMICDMSGLDITKTNIWRDKQTIFEGLGTSEGQLKYWLSNRC